MRTFILIPLLAAVVAAQDTAGGSAGTRFEEYEKRFLAALKADLAPNGTAAETMKIVSPLIAGKLTPQVLAPVYAATRAGGKILRVTRDESTPCVANKAVLYLMVQEKSRTIVTCVFDDKGLLTGYWFKPGPPLLTEDEILARMEKWEGEIGLDRSVLDTDGGEYGTSRGGDQVFPLGSIFKVYILAELARQVEEGKLKLDQKVKIRKEWKSLPSGRLHTAEPGTAYTVEHLARVMIAESDNTATDHLLHLVGRKNIESRLGAYHNSVPARNIPFLSTRELFLIKGGAKEQAALQMDFKTFLWKFRQAEVERRREMVAKLCAHWDKVPHSEMLAAVGVGYSLRSNMVPRHVEIEWFARPEDITGLFLAAHRGQLKGAKTFLRFLAQGSPVYPRQGLEYYGFKGGSETNVFALSALVAGPQGRTVALCICRQGKLKPADATETVQVFSAWIRLAIEDGK